MKIKIRGKILILFSVSMRKVSCEIS